MDSVAYCFRDQLQTFAGQPIFCAETGHPTFFALSAESVGLLASLHPDHTVCDAKVKELVDVWRKDLWQ